MAAIIVALIAGVTLSLSLAGIYALVSFIVTRRTREIGVRAALGAAPYRIVGAIFSRTLAQLAVAIAVGALFAWFVMRDPLSNETPSSLLAVVALMLIAGSGACVAPAVRALRIQPSEAFRAEAPN